MITRRLLGKAVGGMVLGQGGTPPRRAGQGYDPPGTVLAPGGAAGVFRGRLVIVKGGGPPASGLYIYDAAGNLIASAAASSGTGPLGGQVRPGLVSYLANNSFAELFQGVLTLMSLAPSTRIVQAGEMALNDALTDSAQPGLTIAAPTTGVGNPDGTVILRGGSKDGSQPAQVIVAPVANPGAALTSALFEVQGTAAAVAAASGGQVLTLQNTSGGPSNSNLEIIGAAANDNSLGIMVSGDTFNRIKLTTAAMLFGSGAAAQDTQLYRSSAGVFGVDTLLANIGGSVEVWHTLGTPGITGWTSNHGRYRLANDGCIEFDFTLVSNGVAHASSITTYPNTLPAAYQPAFNRAYPLGIDTTITAGDPFPRVFVGTTGTVKIAIPSVAAVTTEISGTFHVPLD